MFKKLISILIAALLFASPSQAYYWKASTQKIAVEKEGAPIVPLATTLNFKGIATVTDNGSTQADVYIPPVTTYLTNTFETKAHQAGTQSFITATYDTLAHAKATSNYATATFDTLAHAKATSDYATNTFDTKVHTAQIQKYITDTYMSDAAAAAYSQFVTSTYATIANANAYAQYVTATYDTLTHAKATSDYATNTFDTKTHTAAIQSYTTNTYSRKAGETYTGSHDFSAATVTLSPVWEAAKNYVALLTDTYDTKVHTAAIQSYTTNTYSRKAGETYTGAHDFTGATVTGISTGIPQFMTDTFAKTASEKRWSGTLDMSDASQIWLPPLAGMAGKLTDTSLTSTYLYSRTGKLKYEDNGVLTLQGNVTNTSNILNGKTGSNSAPLCIRGNASDYVMQFYSYSPTGQDEGDITWDTNDALTFTNMTTVQVKAADFKAGANPALFTVFGDVSGATKSTVQIEQGINSGSDGQGYRKTCGLKIIGSGSGTTWHTGDYLRVEPPTSTSLFVFDINKNGCAQAAQGITTTFLRVTHISVTGNYALSEIGNNGQVRGPTPTVIYANPLESGNTQYITLTSIGTANVGANYVVKRVNNSSKDVYVQVSGNGLIDKALTYILPGGTYNSLKCRQDGVYGYWIHE